MLCSEFKKPGGGKGRPGRNMKCIDCGMTWGGHGTSQKSAPSIIKRRPKSLIIELENSILIVEEIKAELPTTIVPIIAETVPLKSEEFPLSNIDGATSIPIAEESEIVENLPMQEIKRQTIHAKIDLYAIAEKIFA